VRGDADVARWYEIRPAEGYSYEDLIREGVSTKNAVIVKIVDGEVVEVHPYTRMGEYLYKPRFPKEMVSKKYVFKDGRLMPLNIEFEEGGDLILRDGCNPFKQIIVNVVKMSDEGLSRDEIVDYVINDLKVLANHKNNRKWLGKLVEYLVKEYVLIKTKYGTIKPGIKVLPLGDVVIPLKKGYNPILYEMMYFIENSGQASRTDLEKRFITSLKWIERDPVTDESPIEVLDKYIGYLLRKGYIEEVTDGIYRFVKPLDQY